MIISGKDYKPFVRAFNDEHYSSMIVGKRGASPIPHRRNKVVAIDDRFGNASGLMGKESQ